MQIRLTSFCFFTLLCSLRLAVFSQGDYALANFSLHETILFPAATGVNYYPVACISHGKQWMGVQSSPQTTLISANLRIGRYDFYTPKMFLNNGKSFRERVGLGLLYVNDHNGPIIQDKIQFSYAYHLPFEWATVSLGSDLSMHSINIRYQDLKPLDRNDDLLTENQDGATFLQASAGMQISNEAFFVSASARNLLKQRKTNSLGIHQSEPEFYLYGGFTHWLRHYFRLDYTLLLAKTETSNLEWVPGVKLAYRSYNWFSINYYNSGKLEFGMALHLLKQFQIGYSYAYFINNLSYGGQGCHSIYLGRNMGSRNMHGIRKNVKQRFL